MADIADIFLQQAGAERTLSFAKFMEIALYHPVVGYYRRPRQRVGYGGTTDFYTAGNSPVFGELMRAACSRLLAPDRPQDHVLVEIGAEPGQGLFAADLSPFLRGEVFALGRPLALPPKAVVVSNELFDAQPFHRLKRSAGSWREIGVRREAGRWQEVFLEQPCAEVRPFLGQLPCDLPEGYVVDLPLASVELCRRIVAQPWSGLFLAVDYGKSREELFRHTPGGTARAYFRHRQNTDLLERPGDQDLTCHVCWDWLGDALAAAGFSDINLVSQEAFLVRHAADAIGQIATSESSGLSPRKRALQQLLHPEHLGRKFQVLSALRRG